MTEKRKETPCMEMERCNDRKDAYMGKKLQLQNHSLTFMQNYKLLLSSTTLLSCSPMAYNTTASLYKLTCTNYLNFVKCQDRLGHFSWSKNVSNYLDVKLKDFQEDDNEEFRLVQILQWERQTSTSLYD